MAFKITVRPSGHSFEVEPSEILLEAGLRAGLNLDHSCANGSCGECRARLLRGRVEASRHCDYCFSEPDRQQGWFLMCSHRAASDLEIEAHEVGSAAEIPQQRVRAKVSRIEHLQDGVMQLTLRAPRSVGLHFLAGQSVAVTVGDVASHILPIASCPCDSVQLRLHLRRRDGDAFSDHVFMQLRKGAEVTLDGPCGDFTLDEESERPLVFVAWESGFAAVSSLIDHAIQKDEDRSIDLYWLSAIPRGHYLSNYCRAWRDVLDDFRYHSIDLEPAGEERFDEVIERVVRVHSLLADCDYYLALPSERIDTVRAILAANDVDPKQVRITAMSHP
ncbi:MAG: 2Fe-2S iron-sulfur cluster binding domain-containing protein [Gammaproteobacteria bacterium]|nr:2Fe-2S iron-sulfur cluster binding domain-containing protein [Gammaproteobacteria bacterium]